MTIVDVAMPGLCRCGAVASCLHGCPFRPPLPAEPPGHASGMVHPAPVPGCPWCRPVECPCGEGCLDAAACRSRWAASETTWLELAAARAVHVGTATYGGLR